MAGRGSGRGSRRRGGSRSRSRSASRSGNGGGCGPPLCWQSGRRRRESLGNGELLQAASGERHYLLLLSNGAVLACGDNSRGQLGRPGDTREERPVPIQADKTLQFAAVSCGKEHSLAISRKGKVFAWGSGSEGQLGVGEATNRVDIPKKVSLPGIKIIQVSCGDHHSLALSEGSQLFSWGSNSHGQLGLGRRISSQVNPKLVESLKGIPLAQVAAGGTHSFALSIAGTSFGWGRNSAGQLALSGKNAQMQKFKPYSVGALKELGVVYISCGGEHTAVLTQDGNVYTFGDNTCGQLGHSSMKSGPCPVEGLSGPVSQIDCGSKHTLVYVYTTGQVVSFGCGPSHTSNPAHPEALTKSSNINFLIPADDPVNVKHIFAGTYANFVTTYQAKSPSVPKKTLPEISRITQSLTEKWTSAKSTKSKEIESEIETIFSSPACLTASFLKKREPEESVSIGVDLDMARDIFKMLTEKKRLSSMITTCFSEKLLKNLSYHSRYQEALLIFLLLPECPVMHEQSNWNSHVVLFADAVCKMSGNTLSILHQLWKSLQASALNTLVQMLKAALISQLHNWTNIPQNHRSAKALLGAMKEVYKVKMKANCQLPESTFYINELPGWIFHEDRKNVFLRDKHKLKDFNDLVILSDYPFIFNLVSKITLWKADINFKMQEMNLQMLDEVLLGQIFLLDNLWLLQTPFFKLNVSKYHVVEDTLLQLERADVTDLRKQLLAGFIEEIRPKSGGVISEFFHTVFKEMTGANYGMFIYPEKGAFMWFPANSVIEKKKYYLFGILCGLSLYNGNVANIPFPLALFKKLVDKKPSLEDLKELSPILGKNLQVVLNYEADNIEDLGVYFAIHWDQNDVNLISDNSSILVDHTNKKKFISECVNYIFNTSVNEIYEEFQRGFYKVCDESFVKTLFQPAELMQAMTGNTDYDWEQFEKDSTYEGEYNASHPTIQMFWKVFHKLSLEEKKKFLFFITGNDRLQVKGLTNVGIRFRCPKSCESDNLRSLICHSILDLPKYSTETRMEDALQIAINSHAGFDSALANL